MIWATGDCHGDFQRFGMKHFPEQRKMTRDDYIIICGDFGFWADTPEEKYWLNWLEEKSFTTLWVDGNHDNFTRPGELPVHLWHGGRVHYIRPHVLHLMRGQIFEISGKTFFTMGGAQSHDIQDGILDPDSPNFERDYWFKRRARQMFRVKGFSWWPEEMPSDAEYEEAVRNLEQGNWKVDYVITHCAPTNVARIINPDYQPDTLTEFLEMVNRRLDFQHWLLGHYHDNRCLTVKHTLLWKQMIQII